MGARKIRTKNYEHACDLNKKGGKASRTHTTWNTDDTAHFQSLGHYWIQDRHYTHIIGTPLSPSLMCSIYGMK